jgi:DNA-binding response OmpR family regulator
LQDSYDIALINASKLDQLISHVAAYEIFNPSRIETFESASEAMDFFFKKEFFPHLVILDLNVGELSGKAFISLMKNSRKLDSTPIIILSNHGDEREFLNWGANGFYKRPDDFNSIMNILEEVKYKWFSNTEAIHLFRNISFQ